MWEGEINKERKKIKIPLPSTVEYRNSVKSWSVNKQTKQTQMEFLKSATGVMQATTEIETHPTPAPACPDWKEMRGGGGALRPAPPIPA